MTRASEIVAKNAAVLMGSQIVTWLLTLLFTVFVPRYLGPENTGRFHLAHSLWAIVATFVSFGMDVLITKEVARAPEKTGRLFSAGIILRSILYLLALGPVALYLHFAGYSVDTVYVIVIIGAGYLLWQYAASTGAALEGLERMEYISVGTIAGKVFNTTVGITLLLLGYGVFTIAAVTIGAPLITLVVQTVALRRLADLHLEFDLEQMLWMLKASTPYLIGSIFLVVYIQVDFIVISLMIEERAVGWYGAADQLFATFLFVPTVFMRAVFPALSRMFDSGSLELPALMRRSFMLLLLAGVPMGIGLITIAEPLVILLYGADFAPSGPVLAVFGIVLILMYQTILIGRFLYSTDRQNAWTVVMVVITVATIPLDLILIPWCARTFSNGAIGGALAFVITEGVGLIIGLRLLPPGSLSRREAWMATRILAAGLVMGAVTWTVRDYFIAVPVLMGAGVYGALIALMRVITPQDLSLFKQIFVKVWRRPHRQASGVT